MTSPVRYNTMVVMSQGPVNVQDQQVFTVVSLCFWYTVTELTSVSNVLSNEILKSSAFQWKINDLRIATICQTEEKSLHRLFLY